MITGEAASERENWGKLPEDMLLCVELNLPFTLTAVAFSRFHVKYFLAVTRCEEVNYIAVPKKMDGTSPLYILL
jgi:hypothetical protein